MVKQLDAEVDRVLGRLGKMTVNANSQLLAIECQGTHIGERASKDKLEEIEESSKEIHRLKGQICKVRAKLGRSESNRLEETVSHFPIMNAK